MTTPPDPGTPRAEYQRGWREGYAAAMHDQVERVASDPDQADQIVVTRLTQILAQLRKQAAGRRGPR